MADTNLNTNPILSLCATVGERVKELPLKNGQLIFVQDKHRIALDFNGKRRFYNQIEELNTEPERLSLLAPISGMYYFVVDTAVLWTYQDGWIQITSKPEDIVFIGTEMPELGSAKENMLYVNKADKNISIFDGASNEYIIISDHTQDATDEDIESLFN